MIDPYSIVIGMGMMLGFMAFLWILEDWVPSKASKKSYEELKEREVSG